MGGCLNHTCYIALESGNYRYYELTYHLTLPRIERVVSNDTGNVVITDFISQDELSVSQVGTKNFLGFPLKAKNRSINISGSGNCKFSVENTLDVNIIGNERVYYQGSHIIHQDISGKGSVTPVDKELNHEMANYLYHCNPDLFRHPFSPG